VLHLRITAPHAVGPAVTALLLEDPTVINIVVLPSGAQDPAGDLITADVARESADSLIEDLKATGIERGGSVALSPSTVMLSGAARRAKAYAPGHGADALVWAEVESRVDEQSLLTASFMVLMVCATLLGALGAIYDNSILVVGAMVAGPEYGALAAIAVGLVRHRRHLIRRGISTLLIGFGGAIVITAALLAIFDATGLIDIARLEQARPNTSFIYDPDRRSIVVAVIAGIVGTISLTSASATTLVGVLISVTTIPAAGNIAAAIVDGDRAQAAGSLNQLLINVAGIVIAGAITLMVQESLWKGWGRPRLRAAQARRRDRRATAAQG
jgi:uncharacterized hydrophobic protein (TIGR00271 family)